MHQRSRVNPESIELQDHPVIDDDNDDTKDYEGESIEPENTTEVDEQYKCHVEDSDAAFTKHRIGEWGIARLWNSTLRAMCNLRELDEVGKKEDLVDQLMDWVSVIK